MIKTAFSVFDSKSRVYSNPFLATRSEVAIRDFTRAANDPSLDICRFPADFSLVELGSFDDETGIFQPLSAPELIVTAVSVKE